MNFRKCRSFGPKFWVHDSSSLKIQAEPYALGWCRPQTDGPPLRARTLMQAARRWRRHAGGGGVRFLLGLLVGDDRFFGTKMR